MMVITWMILGGVVVFLCGYCMGADGWLNLARERDEWKEAHGIACCHEAAATRRMREQEEILDGQKKLIEDQKELVRKEKKIADDLLNQCIRSVEKNLDHEATEKALRERIHFLETVHTNAQTNEAESRSRIDALEAKLKEEYVARRAAEECCAQYRDDTKKLKKERQEALDGEIAQVQNAVTWQNLAEENGRRVKELQLELSAYPTRTATGKYASRRVAA